MTWIEPGRDGVRLTIRVQPRASRTEVAGLYGEDALKIRLAAPPVDGAANRELVEFLATMLDVAKSAVVIERGKSGRLKTVAVAGVDAARARAGLSTD